MKISIVSIIKTPIIYPEWLVTSEKRTELVELALQLGYDGLTTTTTSVGHSVRSYNATTANWLASLNLMPYLVHPTYQTAEMVLHLDEEAFNQWSKTDSTLIAKNGKPGYLLYANRRSDVIDMLLFLDQFSDFVDRLI